jgi:hypothetical protein
MFTHFQWFVTLETHVPSEVAPTRERYSPAQHVAAVTHQTEHTHKRDSVKIIVNPTPHTTPAPHTQRHKYSLTTFVARPVQP